MSATHNSEKAVTSVTGKRGAVEVGCERRQRVARCEMCLCITLVSTTSSPQPMNARGPWQRGSLRHRSLRRRSWRCVIRPTPVVLSSGPGRNQATSLRTNAISPTTDGQFLRDNCACTLGLQSLTDLSLRISFLPSPSLHILIILSFDPETLQLLATNIDNIVH